MAYEFDRSDDNKNTVVVSDGTFNSNYNVALVGRNVTNYGETIAKTQMYLLENFAGPNAPGDQASSVGGTPVQGQIWFNNTDNQLYVNLANDDNGESATWAKVVTEQPNGDLGKTDDRFSTIYADVFDGVAASARYADLAERFHADDFYEMGTVVKIGGVNEITSTKEAFDNDVFGVVSENPAFLMNEGAGNDESHPPIAFAGRVQVKVNGPVKKGQRIVSSDIPGVAISPTRQERSTRMTPFNVIGRALETSTDRGTTLVWVAIGAK